MKLHSALVSHCVLWSETTLLAFRVAHSESSCLLVYISATGSCKSAKRWSNDVQAISRMLSVLSRVMTRLLPGKMMLLWWLLKLLMVCLLSTLIQLNRHRV